MEGRDQLGHQFCSTQETMWRLYAIDDVNFANGFGSVV